MPTLHCSLHCLHCIVAADEELGTNAESVVVEKSQDMSSSEAVTQKEADAASALEVVTNIGQQSLVQPTPTKSYEELLLARIQTYASEFAEPK